MTMNNNIPGTLSTSINSSAMTRRLATCLRGGDVRTKFQLTSLFKRRPVRRALAELGRNDRKNNAKFAENLLTISVEQFREKWNFDPIKMKPIVGSTGDNADNNNTNVSDNRSIKYEWKLIAKKSSTSDDQKELERTVCSLVNINRRQSILSTQIIDFEASISNEQSERLQPSKSTDDSIVTSTQDSETTTATTTTSLTDVSSTSITSVTAETLNTESITSSTNDLEKRLSTNSNGSRTAAVPEVLAVPTIQCSITASSRTGSRQSKITDFATHRKRVHSAMTKEPSVAALPPAESPAKRQRLQQ